MFKEKYPGTCVHFALINIVGIDLATSGAACFLLIAAKRSWDADTLASTLLYEGGKILLTVCVYDFLTVYSFERPRCLFLWQKVLGKKMNLCFC